MVKTFRPLLVCAAALIVLGAVIWGYDSRRNHPTSQPELSTAPRPAQVAAQVTSELDAAPTLAVPVLQSPPSSPAADTPPSPPVLLVPVPNQAPVPTLPSVDANPELVRVTRVASTSPPPVLPAPATEPTKIVSPQTAVPAVPLVPPPALGVNPPLSPPSAQQADSGSAVALTPPPTLSAAPPEPPPAPVPSPPPSTDCTEALCPWNFQVAVVKGRTQLKARNGNDVQFTVTCNHLTMQTPAGHVRAEGNVEVHGLNVEGSCEKLTLAWHDDNVQLEGKVRFKCKQEGQDVDLTGEQLRVKLAVVEMLPPPRPSE